MFWTEAITVLRTAVAASAKDSTQDSTALSNLGAALLSKWGATSEAAWLDEAIAVLRQAVVRSEPEGLDRVAALSNLADALRFRSRGIFQPLTELTSKERADLNLEAGEIYAQVLQLRLRILGEEHPATLASMNNLATVMRTVVTCTPRVEPYENAVRYLVALGERSPR